jgi:hypothetical protein
MVKKQNEIIQKVCTARINNYFCSMKNFSILLMVIASISCNLSVKTESRSEKANDSVQKTEDENVDNLLKDDSLRIKEKEKELLEKYK